jgi:hypothetical protein
MRRPRVALSCLIALFCLAFTCPSLAQEKPAEPTAAKPDELSPRERIERALKQSLQVEFDQTPLNEAVRELDRKTEAPILLDLAALKRAGKDAAAPVSLPATSAPLRAVLERMLEGSKLAWGVQDGVLVVTTPEEASNMVVTAVYPIQDMIAGPSEATSPYFDRPVLGGDVDTMIKLITGLVEPNSWADVGAPGTIQPHAGALVISNTEQVQLEVQALLAALRETPVFDPNQPYKPQEPIRAFPNSPADARTRKLLECPAALEVESQPLDEVLAQLAKRYGITIEIDRKALADVGLDARAPLTFRLAGASLRSVLKRLLAQYDLAYRIRRGVVVVTTAEEMENWLEVVLYPVGDLLALPPRATLADISHELEELNELVQITIAPNAWEEGTGPPACYDWPQRAVLIFEQSPAVHAQISDLFRQLRTAQAEQSAPAPPRAKEARRAKVIFFGFPAFAGDAGDQLTPLPEIPPAELEKLIRALIAPDAWQEPNTYLKVVPGRIVVKHRPEVVRAVRAFAWKLDLAGLPPGGFGGLGGGIFTPNN